ncbi:MAG: mucD 6 [Gemmataceae bacterium]|nr:mucD 6 [Gemmataceae bacterium]
MTARQLTAALLLAVLAAPASAQPLSERSGAKQLLAPFQAIVAKANSSTVRVQCDEKDAALGTVVFADGFILTKASELRGALTVKLGDGSVQDADIVSVHKPTDLALLKIDMKGLQAVTFSDSKKVPIGNWLAAAGTSTTPTAVGIVSVMTRNLSGEDATVTLNNNRGYLGVMLAREDDTDGGAMVEDLSPDGAAVKAGLKKGDVIYQVNGSEVVGQAALRELLENYRPGEKVTVKIRRKGETLELKATLTRPSIKSRSDIQNNMGGELSGRRTGFPTVLQTDMVLDPKNCGGPVVDLDGKVLGISIARAGRVETWVLPSETIRPLLTDMKSGKFPPLSVKKVKAMKETDDKK